MDEKTNQRADCQYLQQSKQIDNVTQKKTKQIIDPLNQQSGKSLVFKTPYELSFKKATLPEYCAYQLNPSKNIFPILSYQMSSSIIPQAILPFTKKISRKW